MHVCASACYPEARGIPRKIGDLSLHNCLSYTLSAMQGANTWHFGPRGEHVVRVDGTLIANNGDALLAAALQGQGIIYQPHFIVGPSLASGELLDLTLDHPCVDLGGIHAVYPAGRRPPAKVRVMVDYLAEAFSASPP